MHRCAHWPREINPCWQTYSKNKIDYFKIVKEFIKIAVYERKFNPFHFNEIEEDSELEEFNKYDEVNSIDFKEKLYVDKTIRTQFIEIGDKPFTQEQIEYGAKDIITPLQIYEIQKKGRVVQGSLYLPTMGFQLENSFVQYLAKMSLRGVKVDTEGWKEMYKKNKESQKIMALFS